jgi:hypothetical protein
MKTEYDNTWRVIAFVITLVLWIVLLFSIGGCATVKVTTPEGMSIETTTLWKDVNQAEASTENMVLKLGSSTSEQDAQGALFMVCAINPALPMCQQDQ